MKKLSLFAALCLSMNVFAQGKIDSVQKVNFYGVDFSHANLYALTENPDEIKSGLKRINNLFVTEKKKYNIGKCFKKEVVHYCLESTDKNNARLSVKELFSYDEYIELSNSKIQGIIDGLSCTGDGFGLVLIAENLNKQDERGTYLVVFFDEATKEIVYSKRASGKALGFGIRNHWAGSVYDLLKNWRY